MRIFLVFIFLLPSLLYGQQPKVIRSDTITLPFRIGLDQGKAFPIFNRAAIQKSNKFTDLLTIRDFLIQDADLILKFALVGLEEDLNYDLGVTILDQKAKPVRFLPYQVKGVFGKIYETPATTFDNQWWDITEMEDWVNQDLILSINLKLEGQNLDCGLPPKFRHGWLHAVAGGVGLGLIGLGGKAYQDYEAAADNYFKAYAGGESNPDGVLDRTANDYRTRNLALNFAGIAVLVVDGAWLTYRLIRHGKQKKRFEKYCR